MEATSILNKWSWLSQNLCLCGVPPMDIDLLLGAAKYLQNVCFNELNLDSGNKDGLVLVASLQTTYKLAFRSPPALVCERLFHFLMEVPWCEDLMEALVSQVLFSCDQFVQYACSKLLAHVLLTGQGEASVERLCKCIEESEASMKGKLASLTVFHTILDHGHTSNHPSGDASDLLTCCSHLIKASTAEKIVKTQSQLLKMLVTERIFNRLLLKSVDMKKIPICNVDIICTVLRLWDSALECQNRLGEDESTWGYELLEPILKDNYIFTCWPSVAILRFLGIINKYLPYSFTSRCKDASTNTITSSSLAVLLIDLYINGRFDVIVQFAPPRTFGGSNPGGVESVNPAFRLSALLFLKSVVVTTALDPDGSATDRSKIALRKFVDSIKHLNVPWVWQLFSEEDDCLAEALGSTLDIFINVYQESPLMEPNGIFYSLISNLSFDHQVLLDWIISGDTCFLQYFLTYLKYRISTKVDVKMNKLTLVDYSSSDDDELLCSQDFAIVSLCQALKGSICNLDKKGLFPFIISPLVKLLDKLQ